MPIPTPEFYESSNSVLFCPAEFWHGAGWATTQPTWDVNHILAGYRAEILIFIGVGVFASLAGFPAVGVFAIAHAFSAWCQFFGSTDLLVYGPAVLEHFDIVDVSARIADIKLRWALITGPIWFIGPVLILRYAIKR